MYVACTALVYAHFDCIQDITIITVISGAIKTLYLTNLVARLVLAQHIPHVGTGDQQCHNNYYYFVFCLINKLRTKDPIQHCP